MRTKYLPLLSLVLLSACSTSSFHSPYGSGRYAWTNTQCVPYARQMSGIQLYGDAWTWWNGAAGKYRRGYDPEPGAVLVLQNTPRMRSGHLAVVRHILSPREIDVTHSNWGNSWNTRRVVYDSARVQDVSPANDWSSVRFWNHGYNVFGAPYAAYGFIYRN